MEKVKLNDFLVADNRPIGDTGMSFIDVVIYFKNKPTVPIPLNTKIKLEELEKKYGYTIEDIRSDSELFFNEDELLCIRIKDKKFEANLGTKKELEELFHVEFE